MALVMLVLTRLLQSTSTREAVTLKEQLSYLLSKETAMLFTVTFSMFLGYSIMKYLYYPLLIKYF